MASSALTAYRPLHAMHPAHHEGAIQRFFAHNPILSRARGLFAGGVSARERAVEGGHILRQGAESAIVGGLLGLVHVEAPHGGLDRRVGSRTVPVDGLVAGAGFVGSWLTAGHHSNVSSDLRNAGAAALTVLSFRKMFAFAAEKKLHSGGAVGGAFGPAAAGGARPLAAHGDVGSDPIVRAARGL